MTQIETLLLVADSYAAARGIGEARVSTLVFNDGKRLGRIRAGKDIGSRNVDRAMAWFSRAWPTDAPWPAAVARPRSDGTRDGSRAPSPDDTSIAFHDAGA